LTDSELIAVRDGFDARRDGMLDSMVTSPYPDISGSWGKQNFALAALYRNTQITQANNEVIAACQLFLDGTEDWGNFHWRGNLFFRIYRFFAHDSHYCPGRLTPAAEAKICEVLWTWAKSRSKISDADINIYQTWSYWGSENHDMMRDSTAWSAASILKDVAPYNTYTYDDGGTVQQHYQAWTAYETQYFRQRAKKGLCVEVGAPVYTKYTLQSWYNFYDFAENQDLRNIAGMTLDLWWADWAESQINSVWGGGKSRVYREDSISGTSDGTSAMSWYYLNIGAASSKHPGITCMATSTHRLPLVVMDMALDISGRGVYEKRSRRMGLVKLPLTVNALWHMNQIQGDKYVYNDTSISGSDQPRVTLNPNPVSTSGGPVLTDPGETAGLGYPNGNSGFGKCIYFDGVNDGGTVSNSNLTIDPANVCVQFWAKSDAAVNDQLVFDRWGQILVYVESNQVRVLCWDRAAAAHWIYAYPAGWNPTAWNHVAVKVLGTNVEVYVNGVLESSDTLTGGLSTTTTKTTTYIAQRYNGESRFKGYLDEIMISKVKGNIPDAMHQPYVPEIIVAPPAETNILDPDYGGISRYTYVRPEFILGTCMFEKLSESDWVAISSQNRWHGAIFANNKNSRVFPAVEGIPLDYGKTYNAHWSVQNKGTLITQKIAGSHNGGMRVYFSSSYLTISQSGGVVFASSGNAYAAVRPAWGSYTWDDSNWIRLSDPYAPVIMEVAASSDYGEVLASFQSAVLARTPSVSNGFLTYTGLGGSGTFTFDTQGNQKPRINGVPVDFAPSYTFQSPFLNEDWASGVVTITKDSRELMLDFNNVLSGGCGDWGYLDGDLDRNCIVDISDLKLMASDWLFNGSDPVSGSDNYPNITESGWPLPGNYNIPKTTVVPVIDGSVSIGEWTDARTVEMVYPTLVTTPNKGTVQSGYSAPQSPQDYSLYWYLKWDNSNLYILGIVYDQIHDSGDLTAICFNPFNNPSATFPNNVFAWILKSDCTIVPFYTAGPTNSVLACSNGVGNYVFEARIPWTDFISSYVPSNGDVHGFGLLAQDYDTPGVLSHYIYDFGSGVANVGTPSTYNTITLVDQMPPSEAGTSDADIDLNYKVNLADFASIAESWMQCTNPVLDGCVDAR
jgi:hypothetical protein